MQTYQTYIDWTLDTIRESRNFSWFEERRLEWTPLVVSRLKTLIEYNRTFLILTDQRREWFGKYIIDHINANTANRPLLPFFVLNDLCPQFKQLKNSVDFQLFEDLLYTTFPNGYILFYIGTGQSSMAQLAKRNEDSLLWLLDERMPNSFYLDSRDEEIDIKLLQMYGLFDKTIDALMFSEVADE